VICEVKRTQTNITKEVMIAAETVRRILEAGLWARKADTDINRRRICLRIGVTLTPNFRGVTQILQHPTQDLGPFSHSMLKYLYLTPQTLINQVVLRVVTSKRIVLRITMTGTNPTKRNQRMDHL
jgi:hypothetical protein